MSARGRETAGNGKVGYTWGRPLRAMLPVVA
eukprot:CAMPEP_0174929852 /NCGR_PEP_ID=MMETSP1355-20121228/29090_1 /TAXON_ID=464990 /ORGANISM="Hemiselmis tepida, Strain CCMP443" /LENGTH=30 /DNA_ID= /DNA_START= /DNA_END= /DNA_ORIENTATION=